MGKINFWKVAGGITIIIFILNLLDDIVSKITQQTLLIIIFLVIVFRKRIKKWINENIDFTI